MVAKMAAEKFNLNDSQLWFISYREKWSVYLNKVEAVEFNYEGINNNWIIF